MGWFEEDSKYNWSKMVLQDVIAGWRNTMFGYRLCIETLGVPFKNIKGFGYRCGNVF